MNINFITYNIKIFFSFILLLVILISHPQLTNAVSLDKKLYIAALRGNLTDVKELIENGVNVDGSDSGKTTALSATSIKNGVTLPMRA